MFLDDVLDFLFLEVLGLILLQVKTEFGATTERRVDGIRSDGEGTTGSGLPDVLLVVVVFGNDLDALCNKVCRVEADTKLTNHGNISTRVECFHEPLYKTRLEQEQEWQEIDRPWYLTWRWYPGC